MHKTKPSEGFKKVEVVQSTRNAAIQIHADLHRLMVVEGGFTAKSVGCACVQDKADMETTLAYCIKGGGWLKLGGDLHPVRKGDMFMVPHGTAHSYGAHQGKSWTLFWIKTIGQGMDCHLERMGLSREFPVLHLGEEPQVVSLFNEALRDLGSVPEDWGVYYASHTIAHLLSVVTRIKNTKGSTLAPTVEKVAQIIAFMDEHLHEPIKISQMAAVANLSTPHFTVLFKQQIGSTPIVYLQLLRMHRAARLLKESSQSIKEIADRVGYGDPFHFSRQFKAFCGQSPTEYRASFGT